MYFKNRQQAASLLAERLARYKGQDPLVLAIPHGAVPMAKIIADALDVVDNSIATGASMIAALRSVREKKPKKRIAAAAVAPYESLQKIRALADEEAA
jgi:predicted phosphoribosyltransferase